MKQNIPSTQAFSNSVGNNEGCNTAQLKTIDGRNPMSTSRSFTVKDVLLIIDPQRPMSMWKCMLWLAVASIHRNNMYSDDHTCSWDDCQCMGFNQCCCCCNFDDQWNADEAVSTPRVALHLSSSETKNIKTKVNNLNEKIETVKNTIDCYKDQLVIYNDRLECFNQQLSALKTSTQVQTTQINELKSGQETIEQALAMIKPKIEDIHYPTYDGNFTWRISHFNEKWEKGEPIYSPAFYSSPTGYKIRVRLDMHGDGEARDTHMSIFIVLCKGQSDAILTWPFNFPITFRLQDQSGQRNHIVDSFRPETTAVSFQKPTTDMNCASGIEKFCPLPAIERSPNCYVQNDTMFISVRVNFNGELDIPPPFTVYNDDLGLPVEDQEAIRRQQIEEHRQLQQHLEALIRQDDQNVSDRSLIPRGVFS